MALFFVETRFQRQGVGRALFERLPADSPRRALTVNSSLCAVEVYRALGFRETAEERGRHSVHADGVCKIKRAAVRLLGNCRVFTIRRREIVIKCH